MRTIPTIESLAAEVLARWDSNKTMAGEWAQDFLENARIENGDLVYHNGRMSMSEIGTKLSRFVASHQVVMVESVLAQHFERRIPHLAAFLVDEQLNKSACVLQSSDKNRYPGNNAYLEHVELLFSGPVISGEIRFSSTVSWDRHFLWLRDAPLPASMKENFIGKPLSLLLDHPSIPTDLEILTIDDWSSGKGVCVYPKIKLRPLSALQIYRTNTDGALTAPINPLH